MGLADELDVARGTLLCHPDSAPRAGRSISFVLIDEPTNETVGAGMILDAS